MYKLYGATMSPYSMKMRAYLRYRRIPFQWIVDPRAQKVAETKVETYMVPVLEDPNGVFANDSTSLINLLEQNFEQRSSEPDNEADCFLAYLIEDFADEWLLWPFFMYRWLNLTDQKHNAQWILFEALQGNVQSNDYTALVEFWATRQTDLVRKVSGYYCQTAKEYTAKQNEENAKVFAILNGSLQAFLGVMEKAVGNNLFLFGSRPSRADIAIYGMLSQLVIDASPSKLMREKYTYTTRWVDLMDDLSGNEGEWNPVAYDAKTLQASPVADILKLSGKYHLPLLQANAQAINNGDKLCSFEVDGMTFERVAGQRHMPCLPELQKRYSALSEKSKVILNPVLEQSGCLQYLIVS